MAPGKLALVGLLVDLGAHLGHRLLDLDAGLGDVVDQRAGERAVVAFLTVERGLPGAGGKRNQRAFAGLHFGEALLHRHAAGRVRLDLGGERIVAAGIEEHQLDLGVAHGLVERQVDIDRRPQLDVHLRLDVGIDRQQVVGTADRDAVAGVEEYGDVGALRPLAELEQLLRHRVAGEVGAFDDVEADIAQRRRHRLGVDRRVRKLRNVLVGAVADHEGDTLVSLCGVLGGVGGKYHANQGNNDHNVAHLKSPGRIEIFGSGNWCRKVTRKTRAPRHKRLGDCPTLIGSSA